MTELRPVPFGALVRQMFSELDAQQSIFGLPARRFFRGSPSRDLSVRFHGMAAGTPFGPAAGPHAQLAQNIVLAWLVGGRIVELKTVQILDELEIPRPCIDMATIGYNVEWSQELKLEQSLEEYVKAAMLIEMLQAGDHLDLPEVARPTLLDMSVGYDLAGVRSEPVQAFIRGMRDAGPIIDRLRRQLPPEHAALADLDFPTELATSLTLSTFHGCPPDEIERIIELLLRLGLHCVIKLNPTLLGPEALRGLLHDQLGYHDVRVPDAAFDNDTRWAQAVAFVEGLGEKAAGLGLGLGVKLTNTLLAENTRSFFPESEAQAYVSGQPLHVLAINLVGRFRAHFGDRFPISFSAGIDKANFSEAVALGLVPVTVCSDLLKTGGYGRAQKYLAGLERRMGAVGAASIDELVIRAFGHGEAALAGLALSAEQRARCLRALREGGDLAGAAEDRYSAWVSAAKLLNTETYVARATEDPRYGREANRRPPKKVGSRLALFDCLTCDKCLPVCPNAANLRLPIAPAEISVSVLRRTAGGWVAEPAPPLRLAKRHQIGNFADLCNECGNCDVFCPEEGGPYLVKPRFFGNRADWVAFAGTNGFFVEQSGGVETIHGRIGEGCYRLTVDAGGAHFEGRGFSLRFAIDDPEGTVQGEASVPVDLRPFHVLDQLRRASHEAIWLSTR